MVHNMFAIGKSVTLPEVTSILPEPTPSFLTLGIHEGGMGICVHLKQQSSGKEFALKFMRPELFGAGKSFLRFKEELQVWLKASECDGVAEAITIIRINQMPCVLAEWLTGGDLRNAMPYLSPHQKFNILFRTVLSLDWVKNNLNVIHRDIKPSNILLNDQGMSYITDWGLARPISRLFSEPSPSLDDVNIHRADITQAGSFVGTLMYAAPEQIKNARDVDHRADIYSLGCLMYEFETGKPPFWDSDQRELAQKHLRVTPRRLGGVLKRTQLGLESIARKCLEKEPNSRFQTYQVLLAALRETAEKRGFNINQVRINKRYNRSFLGNSKNKRQEIVDEKCIVNKNGTYAVVDFNDHEQFVEEAHNLISLCRYEEAAEILRKYFIPKMIEEPGIGWNMYHIHALNYAFCLENIPGRLQRALEIYTQINVAKNKPVEFYINMSNCLNRANNYLLAKSICEEGLAYYQDDVALLGSYTITLLLLGELVKAKENAHKRLTIRRDVNAIEEMIHVLSGIRHLKRDVDLPVAINIGKQENKLIQEGLIINPAYSIYLMQKVDLLRFAKAHFLASEICRAIVNDNVSHQTTKQNAFCRWTEILADCKAYNEVIERVDKYYDKMVNDIHREGLLKLKYTILADHYMIGKENKKGERILFNEIIEYFLQTEDDTYRHPVMAAKILDWLEETSRALEIIYARLIHKPKDWDAIKCLSFLLLRNHDYNEAIKTSQQLVKIAPWRAYSYDWASYIAEQGGDSKLAKQYKDMGNEVFKKENSLFEELRIALEGH